MEWKQSIPSKITTPELKLLRELYEIDQELKEIQIYHVKGNQKGIKLSWQAKLYNQCDELAGQAREFPDVKYYDLEIATATVNINTIESHSGISTTLQQGYT